MTEVAAIAQGSALTGRYGALEEYVWQKVEKLQRDYLDSGSRRSAAAAGTLAQLRRGLGTEPGSDPAIWQVTLEELPHRFQGRDDSTSPEERAVHAALTLFAAHQQSQHSPMHKRGVSFGSACSALARAGGSDPAVLRRFQALGTASTLTESIVHARGLIGQFRSAGIPFDYGRFTVDLARLQDPRSVDAVRLSWGRAYFAKADRKADPAATEPSADLSAETNSNGESE